jgi:hypothetical protein
VTIPFEEIARAWDDAQALWDAHVNLSPPDVGSGAKWADGDNKDPLAYIDLETRQVRVNLPRLEKIGARGSLPAVLAHELGHHVAFPHTLGQVAELAVLQQRLLPWREEPLANLFFDLQVNEVVGRTRAGELCAVYRGFATQSDGAAPVPLFWFFLAAQEELWRLSRGSITGAAHEAAMEKEFPGCRADARMFAQTFWALPDTHLQFIYFCCRVRRYLPRSEGAKIPMGGDLPEPDEDDWARAVESQESEGALDEAVARGWIDQGTRPIRSPDAIDRITRHLPAKAAAKFRPVLVDRQYARLIEQHMISVPGVAPPPDPFLPTIPVEWQPGDDPLAIDWTLSVIAQGRLAAVQPLRRELEPDPPAPIAAELPAIELYLDTSGSMPNPQSYVNVMTLAALILATAAVRKKGTVRAVIYSHQNPLVSEWMYSEEAARKFLLQYAGGGTLYPFDLLVKHAAERRDAVRVVISDSDFLSNCTSIKGAKEMLAEGVGRSQKFVALLALPGGADKVIEGALGGVLGHPRFRLARVTDYASFGATAALLARTLFS